MEEFRGRKTSADAELLVCVEEVETATQVRPASLGGVGGVCRGWLEQVRLYSNGVIASH